MATVRLRMADGSNESFEIYPLPSGRAPQIEKLARIPEQDVVIGLGKNGKLYGVAGAPTGNYSYGSVGHSFIAPMAKCLHSMKLITKEDLEASVAADEAYRIRMTMESIATYVAKDLAKLGVRLTVGQVNKINANLKAVGSDVELSEYKNPGAPK